MKVKLRRSGRKNKKYMVKLIPEFIGKPATIHFGDSRYSDYTQHKDIERKRRYIARHRANENWNDIYTAGFWSRWLLWQYPNIQLAKRYISQRFGVIFI